MTSRASSRVPPAPALHTMPSLPTAMGNTMGKHVPVRTMPTAVGMAAVASAGTLKSCHCPVDPAARVK